MLSKENIKKVFPISLPLLIGFIPLGFIAGVFLQDGGLNPFQIALMSILVFAGSSQFIAASMFGSMSSIISIVLTAFIVNIRHLLYSSSLSTKVKEKSPGKLILMAQWITDETYAINYEQYKSGNWPDDNNILLGIMGNIYWTLGTVLGGIFGNIIEMPTDIASFSLIAMFIVLIILQINNKIKILVAILTIGISILIFNLYKGSLNIIMISLLATSIGYILDKKGDKNE